jgi:hypothetical protein
MAVVVVVRGCRVVVVVVIFMVFLVFSAFLCVSLRLCVESFSAVKLSAVKGLSAGSSLYLEA